MLIRNVVDRVHPPAHWLLMNDLMAGKVLLLEEMEENSLFVQCTNVEPLAPCPVRRRNLTQLSFAMSSFCIPLQRYGHDVPGGERQGLLGHLGRQHRASSGAIPRS